MKRANVIARKAEGKPQPRLTQMGYTRQGGSPTPEKVMLEGETVWRRVYVYQISNIGSCFVKSKGETIYITL